MNEENERSIKGTDQDHSKIVGRDNRWIVGFALMLTGGILLFRNLVEWQIDRWWFILFIVPSIGAFTTAWRRYKAASKPQRNAVIRPMVIGLAFLFAAIVLLFNLGGQTILPLSLILVGLIALAWILLR